MICGVKMYGVTKTFHHNNFLSMVFHGLCVESQGVASKFHGYKSYFCCKKMHLS
jgi:hypothetical protein